MNIGLPHELLRIDWVADLKERISQMMPEAVFVHDPAGEAPTNLNIEGDACFPFKTMIRTALALHGNADVLLLPRVVEIDGFLMCPNFRGFPDIVELNTKNLAPDSIKPIISPIIECKDRAELNPLAKSMAKQLSGIFGIRALPFRVQEKNKDQNKIRNLDLSKTIAVIGHPYVLTDKRLNNSVPQILETYEYDTVFPNDVPFADLNALAESLDYYAKKMYWRSAREIIGAFLFFSQQNRTAGVIHLAPFNCGIDALLRIELMSLHKKLEGAPPFLTIICDEHTQRDHVVTRVEAFLDMIHGINID